MDRKPVPKGGRGKTAATDKRNLLRASLESLATMMVT